MKNKQVHFTDAFCSKLKPSKGLGSNQYDEYYSVDLPGLILRVASTGRKAWVLRRVFEAGGKRRKIVLGEFGRKNHQLTCRKAEITAYKKLIEGQTDGLKKAETKKKQKVCNITTREMVELFVAFLGNSISPKSIVRYQMDARCWDKTAIANVPVRELTRADMSSAVMKFMQAPTMHGKQRSTDYVRGMWQLASRSFIWAIEEEMLEESFDLYQFAIKRRICRFKNYKGRKKGTRVLTDEEVRTAWAFENGYPGSKTHALQNAANPLKKLQGQTALRMMLLTGLRKCEVLNAQWDEFKGHKVVCRKGRERFHIPLWVTSRSKNGRDIKTPFLGPLERLVNRYKEHYLKLSGKKLERYLFPDLAPDLGRGQQGLNAQLKRHHGATYKIHDIRRTVASRCGDAGLTDFQIARIMNHARKGVTAEHYNHSDYILPKCTSLGVWWQELSFILNPQESGDYVEIENELEAEITYAWKHARSSMEANHLPQLTA